MSDVMMTRFAPAQTQTPRLHLAQYMTVLRLALRTHLTRQSLQHLTARELADIGLTPTQARAEAARKPWDIF